MSQCNIVDCSTEYIQGDLVGVAIPKDNLCHRATVKIKQEDVYHPKTLGENEIRNIERHDW